MARSKPSDAGPCRVNVSLFWKSPCVSVEGPFSRIRTRRPVRKSAHRPRRRRRAKACGLSPAAPPTGAARRSHIPAQRDTRDPRRLLDRILDTPHLAHVVPRLQPEVLHRVIQSCGLEDCGELVALATPGQLAARLRSRLVARRPTRPGRAVRRRSFRRVARSADGIRRQRSRRRNSRTWTSIW